MIWVLVAHLHFHAPIGDTDIWSITGERQVYLRHDACEAEKEALLQEDMTNGQPQLDLECKPMGVVE